MGAHPSVVGHIVQDVLRCGRRGVPRRDVVSTGVGSGRGLPAGCPARTRHWRRACLSRLGRDAAAKWRHVADQPGFIVGPLPVVCRARRNCDSACPARWDSGHRAASSRARRRSRGSYGATATRRGDLQYRATAAQWHADRRAKARGIAKIAPQASFRRTCRTASQGSFTAADGRRWRARTCAGEGAGTGAGRTDAGPRLESGADRRPVPIDFPDDERCASRTRRSTMRFTCKAVAHCAGAVACLRTGRALRVPRARTRGRGKHFVSREVLIDQRPAEAADRPCLVTGKGI